jgi:hypothetical protein
MDNLVNLVLVLVGHFDTGLLQHVVKPFPAGQHTSPFNTEILRVPRLKLSGAQLFCLCFLLLVPLGASDAAEGVLFSVYCGGVRCESARF